MSIPHCDSHKHLGLQLSAYLSWDKHYKTITAHAYKVLGLIHQIFLFSHSSCKIHQHLFSDFSPFYSPVKEKGKQ